jgi:hypothetical protein
VVCDLGKLPSHKVAATGELGYEDLPSRVRFEMRSRAQGRERLFFFFFLRADLNLSHFTCIFWPYPRLVFFEPLSLRSLYYRLQACWVGEQGAGVCCHRKIALALAVVCLTFNKRLWPGDSLREGTTSMPIGTPMTRISFCL